MVRDPLAVFCPDEETCPCRVASNPSGNLPLLVRPVKRRAIVLTGLDFVGLSGLCHIKRFR